MGCKNGIDKDRIESYYNMRLANTNLFFREGMPDEVGVRCQYDEVS